MKTLFAIAGLAVLSLGAVGAAYAQSPGEPQEPNTWCENTECDGPQENNRQGVGFQAQKFAHSGMQGNQGELALLDGYLHDGLADALGLTSEELETRNANGETFWQIAEAQGFTVEEAQAIKLEIREAAIVQAVADGIITPEQAELMASGMGPMGNGGYGVGLGDCDGEGPLGSSMQNFRQNRGGNQMP